MRGRIRKWTFDACKEVAAQYTTRMDFAYAHSGAYDAAKRNKWMNDICSHMPAIGHKYNRCIYAYEFSDNTVYVGLTCSILARNQAHISVGNRSYSAVREHMINTGLTPILKQLTGYIVYWKASQEEGRWVAQYKADGWTTLNRISTGTLGVKKSIYTKEKCKEILLSYEYKRDIYLNHPNLFTRCIRYGWHASLIKKLKLKQRSFYWTKERCAEVAKSVSTVKELSQNNRTVYNAILNNGWKDELMGHLNIMNKHGRWRDKEECRTAAMTTSCRSDFDDKFPQAYMMSRKNKWLDEFFPKKDYVFKGERTSTSHPSSSSNA